MFSFLRRTPVYVKIYPDEIAITNLKTGETVRRKALPPFSNSQMVVAHYGYAEKLCREIVKEMNLAGRSLKTIVQQMKVYEAVLSDSEKRILRDLCEQIGSVAVFIITNDQELPDEEALQVLKENG